MKSPLRSRERILLYGREGSGKTTAALQFARVIDDAVWIISTDNSIDRLLETEFKDLDGSDRLHVYHVRGWIEYIDAMDEVWDKAGRDDLIIIDTITWAWPQVQNWYAQEVFGEDLQDWSFRYRQKLDNAKGHGAGESIFNDWEFINQQWYGHHTDKIVNPPCHLVLTANSKEMRTDGKVDSGLQNLYGGLKMMPEGQKMVGSWCESVIYMASETGGYYFNNQVKDRGRETHRKQEWDDFAEDYLEGVAGWNAAPVKKKTKGKM